MYLNEKWTAGLLSRHKHTLPNRIQKRFYIRVLHVIQSQTNALQPLWYIERQNATHEVILDQHQPSPKASGVARIG